MDSVVIGGSGISSADCQFLYDVVSLSNVGITVNEFALLTLENEKQKRRISETGHVTIILLSVAGEGMGTNRKMLRGRCGDVHNENGGRTRTVTKCVSVQLFLL